MEEERAVEKTIDGKVGSFKQTTKEESSQISDASSRACRSIQHMDEEENYGREEFSGESVRHKERTGDHSSGIESQEKLLSIFTTSNSKFDSPQKTFDKSGVKTGELKSIQRPIGISKLDDQVAICYHRADQKEEETNTLVPHGNLNARINPNHNHIVSICSVIY